MVAATALGALLLAALAWAADGDLDTSFGGDGTVTTAIGSSFDVARGLAIDSQGRIVVAGLSDNGTNDDFALARYNADGSLDTSFGSGGKVITAIGGSDDQVNAVAIDSQGRIVAAGQSYNGSNYDFALARYNASDGSLDTSFDTDGKLTTQVGTSTDVARGLAIDSQGRIVVAGESNSGTDDDFALARYNASDGSLDTSFDTDGKLTTPIGSSNDELHAVAIDSQGRIVAVGSSDNGTDDDFALARYNASDGSLDTSFGSGGKVTTPIGGADDRLNAVAIDGGGRIVAVGGVESTIVRFAVARYEPDGGLDSGFGGGGKVATQIGPGGDDIAFGAAIDSQDRIVAAGYSNNGPDEDFALARYLGEPPAPSSPAGSSAPSNAFTLGKMKRNLRRGTAWLTVAVPGPGTLTLRGAGVVKQRPALRATAARTVSAAGQVKLLVKARGKAKRKLNRTGKVKVRFKLTYTPSGGGPNSTTRQIKLKKRLSR